MRESGRRGSGAGPKAGLILEWLRNPHPAPGSTRVPMPSEGALADAGNRRRDEDAGGCTIEQWATLGNGLWAGTSERCLDTAFPGRESHRPQVRDRHFLTARSIGSQVCFPGLPASNGGHRMRVPDNKESIGRQPDRREAGHRFLAVSTTGAGRKRMHPACGHAGRWSRSDCGRQTKNWPPLALIVDPVMKPASSEARKTTQRAISSGSPRRPTGISGMMRSFSTFSSMARTISVPI